MNDLKLQLKELIITTLDLEDVQVSDIKDDEALFVDGLGLDSIDALELGLAIKKTFDIKIDANSKQTQKHFSTINALSQFIQSQAD